MASSKRQIGFKDLFNLLKSKGIRPVLGLVFIAVAVFLLIPMVLLISASLTQPYEKYDFDAINKIGTETSAKITFIKSLNNVTINDEHPVLISYQYENNGATIADKFETLDLEKISGFNIGTEVKVLTYSGQSVIKGLSPFGFPTKLFYILPGIFLLIGVTFFLVGLIPALKLFNLYKNGVVREAYIVSINSNSGIFSFKGAPQSLLISYFFHGVNGNEIFGDSLTTDYLILNEKKKGSSIRIFVSETDETKSCMVPELEATKNKWDLQLHQNIV
jgi:hypothetical protein